MPESPSILIVVTSHAAIDESHPTGLWFEEFAVPYALFRQKGYSITVASPRGGETPVDPLSLEGCESTPDNEAAKAALRETHRLDSTFRAENFEAVFFPGGHGTMFDLPDNPEVQRLVCEFARAGKIVAAVCHGPACLVNAKAQEAPLVRGRRVTAFTDEEEREVKLDGKMPFLLESRLRELGAKFEGAQNWQEKVVVDGRLITGQNPQSSAGAAAALIDLLG